MLKWDWQLLERYFHPDPVANFDCSLKIKLNDSLRSWFDQAVIPSTDRGK
jgi:hypothetical protein